MQNSSFPSASVPSANMGGLNVSGQGSVILPNGAVALVRACDCPRLTAHNLSGCMMPACLLSAADPQASSCVPLLDGIQL